jgi:hypothetical protein
MPDDSFEIECDRLSQVVDGVQFERVRWAKNEGPMLDRLMELVRSTVGERDDFELNDEGSRGTARRFVLKVHGVRIVAVNLRLEQGQVALWGEAIERSPYLVDSETRPTADYPAIDEAWMKHAIGAIVGQVRKAG